MQLGSEIDFLAITQRILNFRLWHSTKRAMTHRFRPALSCTARSTAAAALRIDRVDTLVLPRWQAEKYCRRMQAL